jgi:hypothetical protein
MRAALAVRMLHTKLPAKHKEAISKGMRASVERRRQLAIIAGIEAVQQAVAAATETARRSLCGDSWLPHPPSRLLADSRTPSAAEQAHAQGLARAAAAAVEREAAETRRRQPKSAAHRAAIAEAVRRKWQDPDFAQFVRVKMRTAGASRSRTSATKPGEYTRAPGFRRPPRAPAVRTQEQLDKPALKPAKRSEGRSVEPLAPPPPPPPPLPPSAPPPPTLEERLARRSALAATALAVYKEAERAAAQMRYHAHAGAATSAADLAEVDDAVEAARRMLARLGVTEPAKESAQGGPASMVEASGRKRAPSGRREMVWLDGRLVPAA